MVVATLLAAGAAQGAQRTFVSTGGANNPTCSLATPCRDFAAAITATSAGGEVIVLDSGGYGPVTITQSVSIIASPGVYAGISVFAGLDGITVNAAGSKVVLRGLTVNGQGGLNGIRVLNVGELHVEGCTLANLGVDGIHIEGGTNVYVLRADVHSNTGSGLNVVSGTPLVQVSDSRFAANGQAGVFVQAGEFNGSRLTVDSNLGFPGVFVQPAAGTVNVTLSDSVITNQGYGFVAFAPGAGISVNAALNRVTSRRNGNAGIESNGGPGGTVTTVVADSHSVDNGTYGVSAFNGATVVVSGTTAAGNGSFDLFQTASVMRTAGNNALTGRGVADVSGVLTANPPK
jgi:hypothetical protein